MRGMQLCEGRSPAAVWPRQVVWGTYPPLTAHGFAATPSGWAKLFRASGAGAWPAPDSSQPQDDWVIPNNHAVNAPGGRVVGGNVCLVVWGTYPPLTAHGFAATPSGWAKLFRAYLRWGVYGSRCDSLKGKKLDPLRAGSTGAGAVAGSRFLPAQNDYLAPGSSLTTTRSRRYTTTVSWCSPNTRRIASATSPTVQ